MTKDEAREILTYFGYCQIHGAKMELQHICSTTGRKYFRCSECEAEGEIYRAKKIAEAKAVLGLK